MVASVRMQNGTLAVAGIEADNLVLDDPAQPGYLAVEKFVANAPEDIVEEEKEKREAALERKTKLIEALERLKKAS